MTPHRLHGEPRLAGTSSGRRGRTFVAWFRARKPTTSRSPIVFQSALWELNPPRQLGRLEPQPLGQGRTRRKVRESNPQGSSLGRFRGGCHRQLGLTLRIKAAAAGIEPASGRLTAAYPYQHGSHRNGKSGWPDLNRRSRAARSTRNTRLSYILPASPRRTVPLTNVA